MSANMGSVRDDSENDEMDHDSNDSEKTSSSSESSDASDSDDSSELDIEECERRRTEVLEIITELERQFVILREMLYKERISEINKKLEEVRDCVATEYRQPLQELQDNMRIRMEVADVLREFTLNNINNSYSAEEQAAKQNFENEKSLLFDRMKEELEEKIRRLEEENSSDGHPDWTVETNSAPVKGLKIKQSVKKGSKTCSDTSRRKPVSVSGPYIVYMLSDDDILEDWSLIKKALSVKRNSERMYT